MSQQRIEDLSGKDKGKDKPDDKPDKPARSRSSSSGAGAKAEKDLRERLTECIDRIADALNERGDVELGEIIEQDAEIMAAGLVSMTRPLKVLRAPLVVLVAIVEPMLSFGRVARVLIGRWAERRALRFEAAAAEQPEPGVAQP